MLWDGGEVYEYYFVVWGFTGLSQGWYEMFERGGLGVLEVSDMRCGG